MALTSDDVMARKRTPLEEMMLKRKPKRFKTRHDQRDEVMRMICEKWGQASAVAEHLGLRPQAVSQWNRVPAHYVLELAPLLGMTPEQIRPDIFKPKRK